MRRLLSVIVVDLRRLSFAAEETVAIDVRNDKHKDLRHVVASVAIVPVEQREAVAAEASAGRRQLASQGCDKVSQRGRTREARASGGDDALLLIGARSALQPSGPLRLVERSRRARHAERGTA